MVRKIRLICENIGFKKWSIWDPGWDRTRCPNIFVIPHPLQMLYDNLSKFWVIVNYNHAWRFGTHVDYSPRSSASELILLPCQWAKANTNINILLQTAIIFFLSNLYLEQGIGYVYVMVNFICNTECTTKSSAACNDEDINSTEKPG